MEDVKEPFILFSEFEAALSELKQQTQGCVHQQKGTQKFGERWGPTPLC